MSKRKNILVSMGFAWFLMLLLSSCFKEDQKIILPSPGETKVATIDMGVEYKTQVFFDFNNGAVLSNDFAAWDLAFESTSNGYHIWVNGGKATLAANTYSSVFKNIIDTTDLKWKWDEESWTPDSTAIGDWIKYINLPTVPGGTVSLRTDANETVSNGNVYIIDRGTGFTGANRLYKVVFEAVSPLYYRLKYATLNNSIVDSITLDKNQLENFTYFTFDSGNGKGAPVSMEPPKKMWNMVFTRYRHIFYDTTPSTPYLVTGALLNPFGVKAALETTRAYEDIDYSYAKNITLKSNRATIGYDWKVYSFDTQSYTVRSGFTYIIKDQKGFYWKLKFIDFYNMDGVKGYPKFQYQRL